MEWKYLIVALVLFVFAIIVPCAFLHHLKNELRIRKGAKRYDAIITSGTSVPGWRMCKGFLPIVEIPELNVKKITSVRIKTFMNTFKDMDKFFGRSIQVQYNPKYPKECTYGSFSSFIFLIIFFLWISIMLFLTSFKSIELFLESANYFK